MEEAFVCLRRTDLHRIISIVRSVQKRRKLNRKQHVAQGGGASATLFAVPSGDAHTSAASNTILQ